MGVVMRGCSAVASVRSRSLLPQGVEEVAVQEFVAQLSAEAFAIAILPWASGPGAGGLSSDGSDPFPKSDGDELGAVV
jgi:hypothetical protein